MFYFILADIVFILHLCFVLFVAVGALLVVKWPSVCWFHGPALLWAVAIDFTAGLCPLTWLENRLLRTAGEAEYQGAYIAHCLRILLPEMRAPQELVIVLGAIVITLNLAGYGVLLRRRMERHRRRG